MFRVFRVHPSAWQDIEKHLETCTLGLGTGDVAGQLKDWVSNCVRSKSRESVAIVHTNSEP